MKEAIDTIHGDRSARSCPLGGIVPLVLTAALMLGCSTAAIALEYADRTPGHKQLEAGLDAYDSGHYVSARGKFRRAAYWADKVAQFNLGVIYLHGQGTEPQPARAWAWFELAAEREYPHMVEVAGRVWDTLDESQRARARRIFEDELLERFGDEVAVPRTARQMRSKQRRATGSRVGFRSGNLTVLEMQDIDLRPAFTTKISASGREYTGDAYYDPAKFDFYNVVAAETRLFEAEQSGKVRLGTFELIDDEDEEDATESGKDGEP